jgi:quinol monooxygenase YgiN
LGRQSESVDPASHCWKEYILYKKNHSKNLKSRIIRKRVEQMRSSAALCSPQEVGNQNKEIMKSICINYITYPEKAEENRKLIKAVFQQLYQKKISGVKYAAFQMGENVFIHLAEFKTEDAHDAFRALPAFQAFQKNIRSRLSSKPITTPMREVGHFSAPNLTGKQKH